MQARERRINQELQSKEEQIILFTEQLKNFQVASETERQVEAKQRLLLQTQNENLQTELEAQLSKELLNLKQTQKLRKSELKNLSELLAKPSQLLKETLVDEASEEEEELNEDEVELNDLKEKITDYSANIEKLLVAVKNLNLQKDEAEKKRDELQKRVDKLEKKGTARQTKIREKIAEVKEVSEIQQLKQDLERYEADLKNIGEGIKKLKTTNLQALQAKDKEIQNLENKLLACQQKSANLQ
ncbi:8399_t:CDS:2 [Ambispora leptoticha]|uniref:8399_t:CDS:1 n=1 Tax=Ambispora leptoticha TaxID=144679 RepID=A0A9N8V089_9GLOM|nr:8399_t:CDS:2 [Ambispora leptoticha]